MKISFHWPRFIAVSLIISLVVVFLLRKKISKHPITKKKMEILKAVYENEPDTVKQILEEMIDSSFYLK